MPEKREPPFEQKSAITASGESPAAGQHDVANRAPAQTERPKAQVPPADPAAFHRWIELEKLKVARKRLDLEALRLHPPRSHARRYVIAAALAFAALIAVIGYLAVELAMLRGEVGQLRAAQADMSSAAPTTSATKNDERAVAAQQPAPPAAEPTLPPMAQASGAPAEAPPVAAAPVEPSPAPAAPAASAPAQLGTGYTVRVFAPTAMVTPAKIQSFTDIIKSAGFEVVVSDSGVFQPANSSISYHAASAATANKLASLIQAKRPAVDFELRASQSIPENTKQVLILNLTEDTLN